MNIISKVFTCLNYISVSLGALFDRVVECCKGKSKPRTKIIHRPENFPLLIKIDNGPIENRIIKCEKVLTKKTQYQIVAEENAKNGIQTVEISGHNHREIMSNYVSDYQAKNNFYSTVQRIIFRTGSIDSSGNVHKLNRNTYARLHKTGLFFITSVNDENKIALPLLEIGKFELFDKLGLFKSNLRIQKELKTIADAHRVMLLLLKTTREKIIKFGLKEKISEKNAVNVKNFEKRKKLNVKKVVKDMVPSNDSSSRLEQTRTRLQRQLTVNKYEEQNIVKDQKEMLECLQHLEKLLTGSTFFSNIYPSKVSAYMLFENLSNHFSDIFFFMGKLLKSTFLKTELCDHFQHQFQIFDESLELLLPYAIEITKAFDINLMDDPNLNHLTKPTQKTSKSVIADLKEYQEIERELAMLMKETNEVPKQKTFAKQETKKLPVKATTNQQPKKSIAKIKINNEHQQDSVISKELLVTIPQSPKELPPQSPRELPKPLKEKKVTDLSHTAPEKVVLKKSLEQQAARLLARQEKNEAREQRIAERRAIRAKEVVNKFKQEQSEQKEAEQRERQKTQVKIHELPSEDLVWDTILPSLDDEYIQMMFGQEENHIQMSHKDVVNLAKTIQEALEKYDVGCAKDLYNYVLSRIHHRHDSDTGDLLPRHYVDILRSCFIIFGIFPKNWERKTEEDFDAMEKYYQRRLDYFYWESRDCN